jgi:predicted Rossmann fold flavoprotein
MKWDIIIIGGGAAGFFTAINAANSAPNHRILILERSKEVLSKVRISGGGRCNLTHACFDPNELVKFYPRGSRELRGPFHRFAPGDTVAWFEERGVPTKIEADGRMFPESNRSQSIVDCLMQAATKAGVQVKTQTNVRLITPPTDELSPWTLHTQEETFQADKLMIASGSSPKIWKMLAKLGHRIVEPVPSLFTFNIKDPRIAALPGLSVPNATVKVEGSKLQANGPLLITHWGMSGPGILRLSAWGARELAEKKYQFHLRVNWLGDQTAASLREDIQEIIQNQARKQILAQTQFELPMRLWRSLTQYAGVQENMRWAELPKKVRQKLILELSQGIFEVSGKSTFKDEFVTAGGVSLKEIDFKRFASKVLPRLWLAGEVLDIDAITGGFNFQAAWTGGWIAGESLTKSD